MFKQEGGGGGGGGGGAGGGPFIGFKNQANPLHNRCGMWDLHF